MFSPSQIREIEQGYQDCRRAYGDTLLLLNPVLAQLSRERAKQYLLHGVGRRLRILHKCIEHIYTIFPVRRRNALSEDELTQVSIDLHAFYVNLFGIFDNLAWVIVHEKQLAERLSRRQIGLYAPRTQQVLTPAFRDYLNSTTLSHWYNEHMKDYRDSLAHRIPLYLPPGINENGESVACPFFAASVEDETAVVMHVQLLANFNTVVELVSKFAELEFSIAPSLTS